jgi:galactoside O-acetyltransferase
MSFLNEEEVLQLGLKHLGRNVKISQKASFYGGEHIEIGDNTRIDDFVVISAGPSGINIGKNIHIAVYSYLIGGGYIELQDFSNISSRVSIYSSNDDYSGKYMTNPTIPKEFTNVTSEKVIIKRHVIIGSGTVILPGVTLEEGVAIGALSLVKANCSAFGVYCGNPAKRIKERKQDLLRLELEYLDKDA